MFWRLLYKLVYVDDFIGLRFEEFGFKRHILHKKEDIENNTEIGYKVESLEQLKFIPKNLLKCIFNDWRIYRYKEFGSGKTNKRPRNKSIKYKNKNKKKNYKA